MKIYLTQIGHPNFRGGGNIVAHKLCEEFSKKGHDVTGIFLAPKNFINERFDTNYKIKMDIGSKIPFLNVWRCYKILKNLFNQFGEPDVIISLSYEGLPVSFIKKNALFIAASHNFLTRRIGLKELFFDLRWLNPLNFGKWLFTLSFFLDRIVKSKADIVQGLCRFGADQCKDIYKISADKIFIIPNGIDVNYFPQQQLSKEKNIIFLGGSVEYKGLDILIEAMPMILKKYSNAKIVILGEMGDTRGKTIISMAENLGVVGSLVLKGLIPQKQVKDYYKNVFLMAIPSRLDLFPMVALEAMASGIPIVASDIGGLPEIIIDEENGLIVEKENPQKLAKVIMYLFGNPIEAGKMGEKGRKIVEEKFAWEKIIEKFEREIYGRLNK